MNKLLEMLKPHKKKIIALAVALLATLSASLSPDLRKQIGDVFAPVTTQTAPVGSGSK